MREILFKAKVKNWKQLPKEEWWVEGYYGIKGKGTELEEHFIICSTFSPILSTYPFYFTDIQIDPDTLCQYTGLTDKNGKKIWENDIVRFQFDNDDCPFPNKDTKKRLGKIFFSDFRASWSIAMGRKGNKRINNDLFIYVQNGNRVEVIGNIFDNPELLEGERC